MRQQFRALPVVAICVALALCFQARPVTVLAQAVEFIEDPEAYAVYAAILQLRSQDDRFRGREIKVFQETRPPRSCIETGRTPGDWQPAIEDFRKANTRTQLLKTGIDLGRPYALVSPSMVQSIVTEAAHDPSPILFGPERGLQMLPSTYLALSNVGFDAAKTFALVSIEDECNSLDVKGGTILCSRNDVIPMRKLAERWEPSREGTRCGGIARDGSSTDTFQAAKPSRNTAPQNVV